MDCAEAEEEIASKAPRRTMRLAERRIIKTTSRSQEFSSPIFVHLVEINLAVVWRSLLNTCEIAVFKIQNCKFQIPNFKFQSHILATRWSSTRRDLANSFSSTPTVWAANAVAASDLSPYFASAFCKTTVQV